MEFGPNTVLLLIAVLSAALQLYYMTRAGAGAGWAVACVTVLAAAGLSWWLAPEQAGLWASGCYAVLCFAPALGNRLLSRRMLRGEYRAAHRLAWLVLLLHPADGALRQVRMVRAMRAAREGDFAPAEALLARLVREDEAATLQLLRVLGRWEDLVRLAHRLLRRDRPLRSQLALALYRLRGLTELGDVGGAFALYRRLRAEVPATVLDQTGFQGELFLAALSGRVALVQRILDGPLGAAGAAVRAYWLAFARLSAGDAGAQEELRELVEQAGAEDAILRRGLEYRLARELPPGPPTLSDADRALLDDVEPRLQERERYAPQPWRRRRPVATLALMGVIFAVFLLQLALGGATDLKTLWRMGALDTEAVLAGQWWRLLASNFLHFGWTHLLLNLGGLLLFGPFVEGALGRLRFVLLYLAAGVGGMGVLLLAAVGWVGPSLAVGASGSIMGVLGATGAILLRGWRAGGAALARRRLLFIAGLLLLQVGFDLIILQSSLVAHSGGAVVGLVLGLLLWRPASHG